jgi:hypothetical protein
MTFDNFVSDMNFNASYDDILAACDQMKAIAKTMSDYKFDVNGKQMTSKYPYLLRKEFMGQTYAMTVEFFNDTTLNSDFVPYSSMKAIRKPMGTYDMVNNA